MSLRSKVEGDLAAIVITQEELLSQYKEFTRIDGFANAGQDAQKLAIQDRVERLEHQLDIAKREFMGSCTKLLRKSHQDIPTSYLGMVQAFRRLATTVAPASAA